MPLLFDSPLYILYFYCILLYFILFIVELYMQPHLPRFYHYDYQGFNNLPPRSPDATPCDFFL